MACWVWAAELGVPVRIAGSRRNSCSISPSSLSSLTPLLVHSPANGGSDRTSAASTDTLLAVVPTRSTQSGALTHSEEDEVVPRMPLGVACIAQRIAHDAEHHADGARLPEEHLLH